MSPPPTRTPPAPPKEQSEGAFVSAEEATDTEPGNEDQKDVRPPPAQAGADWGRGGRSATTQLASSREERIVSPPILLVTLSASVASRAASLSSEPSKTSGAREKRLVDILNRAKRQKKGYVTTVL